MNSNRQWIGAIGAALLFGGAFAPAFSGPFGVGVNLLYYELPAYVVLVAAGGALLSAVTKKFQFVLLSGIVAGLASAYVAIALSPDGTFGSLIQWAWGWVLLALGVGACAYCAVGNFGEGDEEEDSSPYEEKTPRWRQVIALRDAAASQAPHLSVEKIVSATHAAGQTNVVVNAESVHDPEQVSHARSSDEKPCPFCAETIKAAAVKCRYCGSAFVSSAISESVAQGTAAERLNGANAIRSIGAKPLVLAAVVATAGIAVVLVAWRILGSGEKETEEAASAVEAPDIYDTTGSVPAGASARADEHSQRSLGLSPLAESSGEPRNRMDAESLPASKANPQVDDVFYMLGNEVAFVDKKIGPAQRVSGKYRTYEIGDCTIYITQEDAIVAAVGVRLRTGICDRNLYDGPMSLRTFQQVFTDSGRFQIECLTNCSNDSDSHWVRYITPGPRSSGYRSDVYSTWDFPLRELRDVIEQKYGVGAADAIESGDHDVSKYDAEMRELAKDLKIQYYEWGENNFHERTMLPCDARLINFCEERGAAEAFQRRYEEALKKYTDTPTTDTPSDDQGNCERSAKNIDELLACQGKK